MACMWHLAQCLERAGGYYYVTPKSSFSRREQGGHSRLEWAGLTCTHSWPRTPRTGVVPFILAAHQAAMDTRCLMYPACVPRFRNSSVCLLLSMMSEWIVWLIQPAVSLLPYSPAERPGTSLGWAPVGATCEWIPALPLSCVTWDRIIDFSLPQWSVT